MAKSVQITDQVLIRWIRTYCKEFPYKSNEMPRSKKDFLPYFDTTEGFYEFIGWLTGKDKIDISLVVNHYVEEKGMEVMRVLALMSMEAAYEKDGRRSIESLDVVDALLYKDEVGLPGFDWLTAES